MYTLLISLGSAIIGALITGIITLIVTKSTNEQNAKMWQYELFNKKRAEYIINGIEQLANLIKIKEKEDFFIENVLYIETDFQYEKFENLFNSLSKLSVFFSNCNKEKEEISNLLLSIEIYLNIINILQDIISKPESYAFQQLSSKTIIIKEEEIKINICEFINYINSQPNQVWSTDGKIYKFYKNFNTNFNDNINALMNDINNQMTKLHTSLIDNYLQKMNNK